jgi:hypothetical protein
MVDCPAKKRMQITISEEIKKANEWIDLATLKSNLQQQ